MSIAAPIERALIEPSLADFRESYTLPGEAYTSRELFDWEMRSFFDRSWVCVGRSDALLRPGTRTAVRTGQASIVLAQDGDGTLRAFHNICRHRGHELLPVGATAEDALIECPYHGWSYRADGSLRSAPRLGQRTHFDVREHGLVRVAVEEWEGWLFANLSGEAPPFAEHLGNLAEHLAAWAPGAMVEAGRMDYTVEANWKLVHENYQECYHCLEIHPELCRVSPPASGLNMVSTGMWIGGWMDLAEDATTMSLDGRGGAPILPGLDAVQGHRVYYHAVFPNLLISLHPDYVLSHRLEPLSPGRTRVECRTLFPREVVASGQYDLRYASEFWDVTNRQDWAAIESIQRSAASPGFRPGPVSEIEEAVFQFFNMVASGYIAGGPVAPRKPTILHEAVR